MHKTEAAGHVGNMFVEEDVGLGRPPTQVTEDMLNAFMMELVNIATMNGDALLTPATDTFTQARDAILNKIANITPIKIPVRVATTAAIANLAGGAPSTLDGVTLAANNRILVKDQSTGSQNGIYVVSSLGTGSNGTWTRATDSDGVGDIVGGMLVVVQEGAANADTIWELTTNNPITIGTSNLQFSRGVMLSEFTGAKQSLAVDGFQFLPGGLILQFGRFNWTRTTPGTMTVVFPMTFPNAVIQVALTDCGIGTGSSGSQAWRHDLGSTSNFVTYSNDTDPSTNMGNSQFFAIGY